MGGNGCKLLQGQLQLDLQEKLPGVSGLAQEQDALGDGKTSTFMAFDNLGG